MRFLRFLCNVLMFIAITIGVSVVQVGLYNVTALQSKQIDEIHLSAADDTEIAYFDNYAFWIGDIKENLNQDPKYRVTNWASWGWWKTGMRWADTAVDTVIAVVKPIVVPVAQVNAINTYYGYDVNDFESYLLMSYDNSEEKVNNALYEVYVIFDKGYGENAYTVGEVSLPISEYAYTGSVEVKDSLEVEYARWVNKNKNLYNTIWKLNKYNSETYDKYFKKFISFEVQKNEDDTVEYVNRNIKTPVTVMYYQQFVSLILALVFVIKYPIALGNGRIEGRKKRKDLGNL